MSCKCAISAEGPKIVVNTNACTTHKDCDEKSFAARVWIVLPGYIANSYKKDTGADVKTALPFQKSKFEEKHFECSLVEYLQDEKDQSVPLGWTMYINGVATTAHSHNYTQQKGAEEHEKLGRLRASVYQFLEARPYLKVPLEDIVRAMAESWLDHFEKARTSEETSTMFKKALAEAVEAWIHAEDERRNSHATEQARALEEAKAAAEESSKQAAAALAQVAELETRIKQLEQDLADARLVASTVARVAASEPAQPAQPAQPAKPAAQGKKGAEKKSPEPKQKGGKEWVCKMCTLLNPEKEKVCTVCGAQK